MLFVAVLLIGILPLLIYSSVISGNLRTYFSETGEKEWRLMSEDFDAWVLYATVHRLTVDDYIAKYGFTEGQHTDRQVFWETINSVNADIESLKVNAGLLRKLFANDFDYKAFYPDEYVDTRSGGFLTSTNRLENKGAVDYVIKHIGSPYSNDLRMANGYYDCSSLTYRAYKDSGFTIGNSDSNAPTAAEQARWFTERRGSSSCKVLYDRKAQYNNYYCASNLPPVEALQPGDLIFYRHKSTTDDWYALYGPSGENRYRLIDHVSMVFFSAKDGETGDTETVGTWILQARYTENGGVTASSFTYRQSDIELIIRPTR